MKLLFKVALMLLGLASFDVGRRNSGDKEYKGIYVDNLQQIVGNARQEDDFLGWAKEHSFNALNLYNMKALRSALPKFILKARAQGIGLDLHSRRRPGKGDAGHYHLQCQS